MLATSEMWLKVNKNLISKMLSELNFEEVLSYEKCAMDIKSTYGENRHSKEGYKLVTPKREWYFSAQTTIWGMLLVEPDSIGTSDERPLEVMDFLLDIQEMLAISDINLSAFMEEVQQTLYSDCVYFQQPELCSALQMVQMTEVERQRYLSAHPKAIANKGRLGWGSDDLDRFAPESGSALRLRCLAVKKTACLFGINQLLNEAGLWQQTTNKANLDALHQALAEQVSDPQGYHLIPVHPWQFQRFIQSQYACMFASKELVDLGDIEGDWLPQQSIRTLSAKDESTRYDIKTAITILNTSCYRGIPGDFIYHGPRLSHWLAETVKQDPLLNHFGMRVQQEVAGVFCPHPYQSQITGGAYRYKEMLGCIWRERAEAVVPEGCQPMSMATLMQTGSDGNSCIDELITLSGLEAEQWLRKLFRHVVVPLYHLMCQYGVALVAHGQNITLVLNHYHPAGVLIKDFHGDLRLIDQDFPELESLDNDIQDKLTRLPAHYLIHDLLTGHFVTVLHFVSPLLTQHPVAEQDFYFWLADEIRQYQKDYPHLRFRFEQLNLLSPQIEKVCINRVRFKIGYADSDERPVPELGQPIPNPLRVKL